MKSLALISLLAFVNLEVTGHIIQLPKELTFNQNKCDSSYSCADCYTARICRINTEGSLESLGDIKCSPDRPYCDSNTGTCVSVRPPNCAATTTKNVNNLVANICSDIFSCFDCNTAQICKPTNSGLVHFKNLPCTDESPFCNSKSGTCGTEQSLGCGKMGAFVCMHDGKFPDADCDSYHFCSKLTDETLSCAKPNEHYDPKIGKCSSSVPCQSFSCLNNLGMKVPHPRDPRFFAFCGAEGPIVIDSCPTPYELNATSQRCEATCHYNGLIQDINDCHFYYKCTEIFLTESMSYFEKERKRCPEGEVYDPAQYLCVSNSSNIPSCTA
ncbi:uncharacterized protein [Halyomorpha halys]|uniref:uncharacterized protein n=1 Tax=Halyomorpha halys TaxID=286706 RepID=UPI0006D4F9ED|nr:uncharacterized protein LOC106692549 [Halyomorpha halys]